MTTEIIRYEIGEGNAQAFEKAYQKAESILQASMVIPNPNRNTCTAAKRQR
jgi:hypothetical protein